MIERILVPTDGSPESDRAIPIAEEIAKANGALVLLVQVTQYPVLLDGADGFASPDAYEALLDAVRSSTRSNLERLSDQLLAAGVRVAPFQIEGSSAAGSLLDFETKQLPELVVMSSHGRTGLARFALGSVADRIVREGTVPVLVVQAPTERSRFASALIMLDGSGVAEQALPIVEALAGRPLQDVTLFRAVADPDDRTAAATYLRGVMTRLVLTGMSINTQVDLGDPTVLIERAAHHVDFIILCTHGRGGINRFRHGSVAERVVREATKPVLLVRAGMPVARGPTVHTAAAATR